MRRIEIAYAFRRYFCALRGRTYQLPAIRKSRCGNTF
jgi:hypothetical protein